MIVFFKIVWNINNNDLLDIYYCNKVFVLKYDYLLSKG